ncbi:MAG TPA: selenocysteine-specific translation elongation factor [Acidimicrobiia bacterium]
MPLIGTAGHVDHGKSTLVEALTGRDPDRWEEEKRRGLTIDLGFAWARLEGAGEVSFVDVPGHERFLKNMLAGIEAVDVALFVVAADEGWKPQSEEHLAVLDLLGVGSGVVALTKVDLVDDETAELAELEVREKLAGSSLSSAEIIPVSARTGSGIEALRTALAHRAAEIADDGDRPRLWIDRAFTVTGAGTVVTGSLIDGWIKVGDKLEVLPGRRSVRVRGMQSHETEVATAGPGRRVALNLSGVERSQVPRGSMLGIPGQWLTSNRFTGRIRTARYVERLPQKGSFHLHFGSGAHPAVIKRREGDLALIQVAGAVPMRTGDRFILRDTGRRLVVAGGIVLDPDPGPSALALASSLRIDPSCDPDQIATDLLAVRGTDGLSRLAAHSGGGSPPEAVVVGALALTRDRFEDLEHQVEVLVTAHHDDHPLRAGISAATLATSLGVSQDLIDRIVEQSSGLERIGPDVALADHSLDIDEAMGERWRQAESRLRSGLAVPTEVELGLGAELTHLMVRNGRLVRVSDDLLFLPDQIDEIVAMIRSMGDGFTVSEFRDRTGLSRKYAVPLLEWADKEGLTVRRGDRRHLR